MNKVSAWNEAQLSLANDKIQKFNLSHESVAHFLPFECRLHVQLGLHLKPRDAATITITTLRGITSKHANFVLQHSVKATELVEEQLNFNEPCRGSAPGSQALGPDLYLARRDRSGSAHGGAPPPLHASRGDVWLFVVVVVVVAVHQAGS